MDGMISKFPYAAGDDDYTLTGAFVGLFNHVSFSYSYTRLGVG